MAETAPPNPFTDDDSAYLEEKEVGLLLDGLCAVVLDAKPKGEDALLHCLREALMNTEDMIAEITAAIKGDARFQLLTFEHNGCRVQYYARTGDKVLFKEANPLLKREIEVTTLPQKIWPASFPFAEYLTTHTEEIAGKRVLELGSGVGLVGMVAAAVGAEQLWMSDLALSSVSMCRMSVAEQANVGWEKTRVCSLKWGDDAAADDVLGAMRAQASDADGFFDTVIGADVFYFGISLKLGLATAHRVLKTGGLFLCVSAVRSNEMEDALNAVTDGDAGWELAQPTEVLTCSCSHAGQIHDDFKGVTLFVWRKI